MAAYKYGDRLVFDYIFFNIPQKHPEQNFRRIEDTFTLAPPIF